MTAPERPPVARALDELGVPCRVFQHPGPVESLEQAARERGQAPEQVIRSILFRLGSAKEAAGRMYVMALVAGARQVSWPALRRHLGTSRVTMASAEEVLAVTGYPIGAVSPFGLPSPLRVLVDEAVFAVDEVSVGSGVRGTTVILRSADLRAALPAAEVSQFAEAAE